MPGELSDVVIEVRDEPNQRIGMGHCHINEFYVSMLPLASGEPCGFNHLCRPVHGQNGLYLPDVTMPS